ncbi:pleurotolysin A [Mucidula mucida]|nr:pleurotolysin A [Mucidula mucida]
MAYAQWVIIIIHNVGAKPLKLKNLKPTWGKLHADGDKDHEVSASDYEGKVVGPDEKLQLNACGSEGDKAIRHFYWDCPWGSKTNTWTVSGSNTKWMIEYSGQNLDSGALGTITVDALRKGV